MISHTKSLNQIESDLETTLEHLKAIKEQLTIIAQELCQHDNYECVDYATDTGATFECKDCKHVWQDRSQAVQF